MADGDPFKGIPFLGDIASILGGSSESLWEGARQAANQLATGGKPEHNVDPVERHRLSEISRVAELHVGHITGLDVTSHIEPVTRSGWAADALDAIRPLMDRLSERLSEDSPSSADPFASLLSMMSPMTVAMTAGMMAGHLGAKAFGNSDLIVPRSRVLMVTANISDFAGEWGLDVDDVMLWVAIREHALHSALAVPSVHERLDTLLLEHIEGFRRRDPSLEDFGDLELPASFDSAGDPQQFQAQMQEQLQRIFGNPELLLGIARDESHNISQLETLISVLTAYIDHVVAKAGPRLIGSFDALSEAVRRRQITEGADYADRLLGVRLSVEARDRGEDFVSGVVMRTGSEGLARLFEPAGIPTPSELVAPGLWLARLDLPPD
ncbi:zinc-dependent metalloprotease [Candidatus Poriferisodalis sp.]|uniref:zinc-dependent metalloprotease n=1 Tax=Candidatus Poriferisodalis sp. TaxID=3101277 RepID=UPI003B021EF5